MLRTNSKKAIENIKAYIMAIFNGENYDIETPETFKETATIIYNTFAEEFLYEYNRRRNEQEVFTEWCAGLPSIIDTCYYYNRPAVKDLGDILEETEEERNRYTESDAERVLTYLIYREIKKAVK
jgi:hypothetical protein